MCLFNKINFIISTQFSILSNSHTFFDANFGLTNFFPLLNECFCLLNDFFEYSWFILSLVWVYTTAEHFLNFFISWSVFFTFDKLKYSWHYSTYFSLIPSYCYFNNYNFYSYWIFFNRFYSYGLSPYSEYISNSCL